MIKHVRGSPPTCHPERPHFGKGLCKPCYQTDYAKSGKRREWYLKNREVQLAKSKQRYQQNKEVRLRQCKEYREQNKDKERSRMLRYRYGISLEDYNRMLKAQQFSCKLCGKNPINYPVVDHSHITNTIRGIVCQRCNVAIGFFESYSDVMDFLPEYLRG